MAAKSKSKKGSDLKTLLWEHKLPLALIVLFLAFAIDFLDKRYSFYGTLNSLIPAILLLTVVLIFPIIVALRRYGWKFGIAVLIFSFLYLLLGQLFCNAISPLACLI